MSRTPEGKELLASITDNMIAALVSGILRQAHPRSDTPIKRIALVTGANHNNIAKWYHGSNLPKLRNFLMLAKHYPNMLRLMLQLIGRGDVWELCVQHGIPQKMLSERPQTHPRQRVYSDRFVSINVVVDSLISSKLNQRQLWFLGSLQQGYNVKVEDIVTVWKITCRTARRDITGLKDTWLIRFAGARRNGHYELYRKKKAERRI